MDLVSIRRELWNLQHQMAEHVRNGAFSEEPAYGVAFVLQHKLELLTAKLDDAIGASCECFKNRDEQRVEVAR